MSEQLFHDYLARVKTLSHQIGKEPRALDDLLHYIAECRQSDADESLFAEFFNGEQAFYTGDYENALKSYLESKELPFFEFFCYRASAYIYQEQGEIDKALSFIQQALEIFPDDYGCLVRLGDLLSQTGSHQEAEAVLAKAKIVALKASSEVKEKNLAYAEAGLSSKGQSLAGAGLASDVSFDSLEQGQSISSMSSISPFTLASKPAMDLGFQASSMGEMPSSANFLEDYRAQYAMRLPCADDRLFIFQGWHQADRSSSSSSAGSKARPWSLCLAEEKRSTGGFFIRWQGKGIAINPDKSFLDDFHDSGLHMRDIDYVIATHFTPSIGDEIKKIYSLCYQVNKGSKEQPHVINYYLQQGAYHSLASHLIPHFKCERHSVHQLETFGDGAEAEMRPLGSSIVLNYFPLSFESLSSSPERFEPSIAMKTPLGIRLELKSNATDSFSSQGGKSVTLGMLFTSGWTSLLKPHLKECDLLLGALAHPEAEAREDGVDHEELGKATRSMIKEVGAPLLLATQFSASFGDRRLEHTLKLRHEAMQALEASYAAILPADRGMEVDLRTLQVRCSITGQFVSAATMHVMRPKAPFGRLQYLSPSCCL